MATSASFFPLAILWHILQVQGLLPAHFHCQLLGRHQTRAEAGEVWRSLKQPDAGGAFRADITCCSVDKIKSILEYTELVLSFKLRSMDQQVDFADQVQEALRHSKSESPCQPFMQKRFQARLEALKQVALPLGKRGIQLQRKAIVTTLRSHCLKPRRGVARATSLAALRRLVRRFVVILEALELSAQDVMDSDAEAIQLGRQEGLLNCFQLPLLAGQVGVTLPVSNKKILADAVAYPFQRPGGSVRTWHVWVDRFSIVFSRLLAKLVYQLKMMTASLDYTFLKGSGSFLFWGDEHLLTSRSQWHWPNHLRHFKDEEQLERHPSGLSDLSALSFVISNKTSVEMVETAWSAAAQVLEASEALQVLFLEDTVREPWQTSYRPMHAADIASRCHSLSKSIQESSRRLGISRNVSAQMVWRRQHSTLSNPEVVALNLAPMNCKSPMSPEDVKDMKDMKDVKVLMIDLREPREEAFQDLDDLLRGKFSDRGSPSADSISYSSYVSGLTGNFVRKAQERAGQEFHETLQTLAPYLDFHRRAVQAWGRESVGKSRIEKNSFRALIYVCNPLTLCGGHGDRTNGILSAFLIALLTSRAFFIDFDSPLSLSLALQPRQRVQRVQEMRDSESSESNMDFVDFGDFVLDWRLKSGSMGHGSQNFYLDDRVSFQEDLTWLVEDSSQILQLSMNHRELQAILAHPLLKRQARAYGLQDWPHLVARLWDILFQPTPLLQARLVEATEDLGLSEQPLPWVSPNSAKHHLGYLALHFRAGNESGRLWWDPSRHTLEMLPEFLRCAAAVEAEIGLPSSTPWFLSSDTLSALEVPEVQELHQRGKLVLLDDKSDRNWHLAHVDRSHANLGLQGFIDSYVAYLLLASARAVVLSRSFFGETAAEIGAVPHVYFAEGCVRTDIHSS